MAFRDLHTIREIFSELDGRYRLESALLLRVSDSIARLRAWSADPANKPRRRASNARYKKRNRQACSAREARRYQRIRDEQPARHAAALERARARYAAKKADPEWLANRRAKAAAWMRVHRAAIAANTRARRAA